MSDRNQDSKAPVGVGTDVTLPQLTPTTPPTGTPGSSSGDRNAPLRYKAGDLIAERYKVLRLIGEGGMGEVYEAEDLLLKEPVALKTLRAPAADDETVVTRFKREIQLARKVTHPNVCRLFDVGIDRRGSREAAFLTMELLEGETLSARVRREGRLSVAEALPIAEQIAAALTAAHAAGIIHRDLKCANVILVKTATGTRAVVTDFGLARVAAEGSDQVTGDAVVGSPAYMAPEQVEGGRRLTGACDIYAFGVVLFEMVTGKLPFVGDTPLATAVMRIREAPPSPRTVVKDLDIRWERAILSCLERAPEDRPEGPQDVIRILRGETMPKTASTSARPPGLEPPGRSRPWARTVFVAGLAVIAIVGGVHLATSKRSHRGELPPEPPEAPSPPAAPEPPAPPGMPDMSKIAKLPYMSKEFDKQLKAQVRDALRAAETAKRQAFKELQKVGDGTSSSSDEDDSSDKDDDEDSHATPAKDRRSVAILGFKNLSGKPSVDYLSAAFAQMLATELMAGEELRTVPTESVTRAKRQLHLVDADSYAKDTLASLRKMLDSDFIVTGSYISVGTGGKIRLDLKLQDTSSGETVASIAQSGSEDELPDLIASAGERLRDALQVEQPSANERDWARAMRPKTGDAAKLYGEGIAQLRVSNCGAARAPLEQAIAIDPAYALAHKALSEVLNCLGFDSRAREEAEKAFSLASDLPAEVRLNVQAHLEQLSGDTEKSVQSYGDLYRRFPDNFDYGMAFAKAQARLGDVPGAKRTLAGLRRLPPPAGDNPEIDCQLAELAIDLPPQKRLEVIRKAKGKAEEKGARLVQAEMMMLEGRVLFDLGRYDESLEQSKQASAIFEASGDRDGQLYGIIAQARVYKRRGDDAAVARLMSQATNVGKDLDSVRRLVDFHQMIGTADLLGGDLAGAQAEFEAALKLVEKHRTGAHVSAVMGPLAVVAVLRGDLRQAEKLVSRAEREEQRGDSKLAFGGTLFGHAQIDVLRGDLDGAREHLKAALGAAPYLNTLKIAGVVEAQIAMAEGRFAEAEAAVRKAPETFEDRVLTLPYERDRILVESLIGQGKYDEARAELDKAKDRFAVEQSYVGKLTYALLSGHVAGKGGKGNVKEALTTLSQVSSLADKRDLVYIARQADYARAELLAAQGDPGASALFAQIAKDADRRDFDLLAAQAKDALKRLQ